MPLGAEVSREILEAIFRKVSPVHDGAAVISGGRIARVGVVLPLTEREDLPKWYGTRHRAAVGLTERSDAIAVSEDRGSVVLFDGTEGREVGGAEDLSLRLVRLAGPPRETPQPVVAGRHRPRRTSRGGPGPGARDLGRPAAWPRDRGAHRDRPRRAEPRPRGPQGVS